MSTKTLRKRIALVAVSALGFGLMSSSSSQAAFAEDAIQLGKVTLDNSTLNLAGRVNNQITITLRGDLTANATAAAQNPALSIAAAVTSQPASSTAQLRLTCETSADANAQTPVLTYCNPGGLYDDADGTQNADSTSASPAVINYAGDTTEDVAAGSGSLNDTNVGTITFTPTHVGTYTIVAWNENDRTVPNVAANATASTTTVLPALSGSESYLTFTINVTNGVSSMTVAAVGGSGASVVAADSSPDGDFADFGEYGSLLKVSLKDANGNAATLAAGEIVSIDPSGTGDVALVNNSAQTSTAGAAYSLTAADFSTSGVAWVNITNTTAEVVTVVATSGTVVATTSIEFLTTDNAATFAVAPKALTTGWAGSGASITTPRVSSITWAVPATATLLVTEYAPVRIHDELGRITGNVAGAYDLAIAGDGSFAITATATADSNFYDVSDSAGDADDAKGSLANIVTAAARSISSSTITLTPSAATVAIGGSLEVIALVKDQYGVAYASGRVTASMSGRNSASAAQTSTTNSSGKVSFKFTDAAAAASPLTSDTVTITAFDEASSGAKTATITWSAVAVKTVTLTAEDEDSTIPGTVTTDIAAGATGAASTVKATVKDASGNLMAGVPVTFAVSGLTGAEVHTTLVTVFTGTDGTASSKISSYAAGKATVTATAGGVSDTDSVYFTQKGTGEVRKIAATASGRVITATATDRYGNPIQDVALKAIITGNGFFGTGTNVATGNTDKNGQVKFLLLEGNAAVSVEVTTGTALAGQTADAASKVGTGLAATSITAYTAGDALADQKGLGGSFTDAGVNSVTVSIAADTAAADSATAAADAAAEATDAANAATDAANAAAEAADAATAAAQDAADAVAALSTQVSEMVDALKKQITSLTNLVIKIQKKVKA